MRSKNDQISKCERQILMRLSAAKDNASKIIHVKRHIWKNCFEAKNREGPINILGQNDENFRKMIRFRKCRLENKYVKLFSSTSLSRGNDG